MARYDYQCDKCGYIDEQQHGMLEEPEIKCPVCEDEVRHKVPASFIVDVQCSGFVGKLN